jgi:hypothetical protein
MSIQASMRHLHYLVLDNFLPEEQRTAVWEYFCTSSFFFIHKESLDRIFRFGNGQILIGPGFVFSAAGVSERSELVPDCLDVLTNRILTDDRCLKFLASCDSWSALSLCPYIYPVGSALSWHTDDCRSAALIYYAHPKWHPNWGGELMIEPSLSATAKENEPAFCSSGQDQFQTFFYKYDAISMINSRDGAFIFPTPNRLVLIRGGTLHCIKRVEVAAGESFRASISGFFYPAPETPSETNPRQALA